MEQSFGIIIDVLFTWASLEAPVITEETFGFEAHHAIES